MKKYINKVNIILVSFCFIFAILLVLNSIFDFEAPAQYGVAAGNQIGKTIKDNDVIETKVISKLNKLESLRLEVADVKGKLQRNSIFVSIYDNKNKLIYYSDLVDAEFFDNKYFNFKFNTIKESYNKEFKLVIKSNKIKGDYSFSIYNIDNSSSEVKETYPISQFGYTVTSFYTWLFTVIIFVLFYILCRYNLKNNSKLKDKLLHKKIVFMIEFFVSFIACSSLLCLIYNSHSQGFMSMKWYGIFFISTLILIAILSMYLGDKKLKKENLFLLLSIPIGMMFLIFLIPLNVPDEFFHYKIAYKVSQFKLFDSNISIPKNINVLNSYYDVFSNLFGKYENFVNVSVGRYHPLLYIFSAVGISLSRLLHLSPIIGEYMGSGINFLVFLIVGYYAVKKIPMGKVLMIIYLLNPMFLQQATSFSVDAMINIFSMLFISYILYIRYESKKVDTKDFIILLLSYIIIFIGKYAYFLFALLFILIWKPLKSYIKKNKKVFFVMLLIFLIIGFGWLLYTKILANQTENIVNYNVPQVRESKLTHLLHNPISFVSIYVRTLLTTSDFYISSFLGSYLGYLNITISKIYIFIYLSILILSAFICEEKVEIDKKNKLLNIITFILIFNIILCGLYLKWGIITDTLIQGVQGRYFIPIVILLLLLLVKPKQRIKIDNIELVLSILLIINNIFIVKEIMNSFFI